MRPDPLLATTHEMHALFSAMVPCDRVSRAVYLDPDTIMLGNIGELGTMLDHQVRSTHRLARGSPDPLCTTDVKDEFLYAVA